MPGVAGALIVFAGVDLAAAGALAGLGDATGLAGALDLRAAFLAGRPKPSAIATSVSSSASALPASTCGVMYGAAASKSVASCGGKATAIGMEQAGVAKRSNRSEDALFGTRAAEARSLKRAYAYDTRAHGQVMRLVMGSLLLLASAAGFLGAS